MALWVPRFQCAQLEARPGFDRVDGWLQAGLPSAGPRGGGQWGERQGASVPRGAAQREALSRKVPGLSEEGMKLQGWQMSSS